MACNCVSSINSDVIISHIYSAVSFWLTSRTCKSPLLKSVIRGGGNFSGCRESTINSSSRNHRIYFVGTENQIQMLISDDGEQENKTKSQVYEEIKIEIFQFLRILCVSNVIRLIIQSFYQIL